MSSFISGVVESQSCERCCTGVDFGSKRCPGIYVTVIISEKGWEYLCCFSEVELLPIFSPYLRLVTHHHNIPHRFCGFLVLILIKSVQPSV